MQSHPLSNQLIAVRFGLVRLALVVSAALELASCGLDMGENQPVQPTVDVTMQVAAVTRIPISSVPDGTSVSASSVPVHITDGPHSGSGTLYTVIFTNHTNEPKAYCLALGAKGQVLRTQGRGDGWAIRSGSAHLTTDFEWLEVVTDYPGVNPGTSVTVTFIQYGKALSQAPAGVDRIAVYEIGPRQDGVPFPQVSGKPPAQFVASGRVIATIVPSSDGSIVMDATPLTL